MAKKTARKRAARKAKLKRRKLNNSSDRRYKQLQKSKRRIQRRKGTG